MKRPSSQGIFDTTPPAKKRSLSGDTYVLLLETNRSSQIDVPSQIRLGDAQMFRIGRSPKCDILLGCQHISRIHATLHRTDSGWGLKDQHSHNGTYVNGFCISQCRLHVDDVITFGGSKNPQKNDRLPCMECGYCLKSTTPFITYKIVLEKDLSQVIPEESEDVVASADDSDDLGWFAKHPALRSIYDSRKHHKSRIRALEIGKRLDHLPPDSIAYKVALQLFLQKQESHACDMEHEQTEFAKKRSLMEAQIKAEFGLSSEMFQERSRRWRMLFQLSWQMAQYKSEKSCDLDYTGCEWTEKMLMKYLKPEDILSFTPVSEVSAPAKMRLTLEVQKMMSRIGEIGDSLYGWAPPNLEDGTGLDQLPELGYCEAVSRLFIDAILIPVLNLHQMKMQLEETYDFHIRNNILPTARFDYLILSGKKARGVLEAKRAGIGLPRALVQTLLQLLLLASAGSKDKKHDSFIGIVSDGLRWLFIILSENKIFVSEVFNLLTRDDVFHVACVISNLLLLKFPIPSSS